MKKIDIKYIITVIGIFTFLILLFSLESIINNILK